MDREALFQRLKSPDHENWRLKPYDDKTGGELLTGHTLVGKLTIAAGVNLADGLSADEARWLTVNRIITRAEADLDAHVPWWRNMDETRQQVLAELCFWLGWPKLETFTKMLGYLQSTNTSGAAEELLNSELARTEAPARARLLAHALKLGSF